jgi:hypothetical protein
MKPLSNQFNQFSVHGPESFVHASAKHLFSAFVKSLELLKLKSTSPIDYTDYEIWMKNLYMRLRLERNFYAQIHNFKKLEAKKLMKALLSKFDAKYFKFGNWTSSGFSSNHYNTQISSLY